MLQSESAQSKDKSVMRIFSWGYREHQSGNRVVSEEIKNLLSPPKKTYTR